MPLDRTGIDAIQDHYRKWKEDFYDKTFVEPNLRDFMMVTTQDGLVLPSASVTSGLQNSQVGHHQRGAVALDARELRMRKVKFDQTFDTIEFSTDYYYSYMRQTGNNPRQFPFQSYVIQLIYNQLREDYALEALWNGKYLGVIPGAPNNPSDVMDGLNEIILGMISAGEVVVYITGVMDNTNAYSKTRQFVWDNLDTDAKRKKPHVLFCSLSHVDNFREDYEDAHGSDTFAKDPFSGNLIIPGTNTVLAPQDGLSGSAMVLARRDNIHTGFDGSPHLELDYSSRALKVEIDWKIGVQVRSGVELYVNEWVLPQN